MANEGQGTKASRKTNIHVTALDGLLKVNSLFTVAVFLGISLASPGQKSLHSKAECHAEGEVARRRALCEVVSFSGVLFSSLIVQGLKLALIIANNNDANESRNALIGYRLLRTGFSTLTISMVLLVEIRGAVLPCSKKWTRLTQMHHTI